MRTARTGFVRRGWKLRVHPVFRRYWLAKRNNRELPRGRDLEQKFKEWFEEFRDASQEIERLTSTFGQHTIRHGVMAAILTRLDVEGPSNTSLQSTDTEGNAIFYPVNPEGSPLFRMLVFLKHGVTFRELIRQVDIEKSQAAHRKLISVHRDYWRILTGAKFHDLKLKFNWDHFEVITHGLDFGLDGLDEYELADCLDEICPCRLKHSPTYLKKLRMTIKRVYRDVVAR